MVSETMCGDGFWHINWCHLSSIMQCSGLQKDIGVKCTRKINKHKTTFGTLTPCYSSFGPNFDLGLLSTISISFVEMTSIVVWVGLHKSMPLLDRMFQLYGLFNMALTLFRMRYHLWKRLGLCLILNA
jgi:hypothetical protein